LLHALECLIMPVAGYHALCSQGATWLQRTSATDLGSSGVVHGAVFTRDLLAF
jgi:hypothetical protein